MSDPRGVTRVVDELLWVLRRGGFSIATSQAIDVLRAVETTGFTRKDHVREAVACVVVSRPGDRARFDTLFDGFFSPAARRTSLWERLTLLGFDAAELDVLRELLAGDDESILGALLGGGAELDRLLTLTGATRTLDAVANPLQIGFATHRLLQVMGNAEAHRDLAALGARLIDALGRSRAEPLLAALEAELDRVADELRAHVHDTIARRQREGGGEGRRIETAPFASLSEAEIDEVRRAVRRFVERLRGGERVRARRARRGRIDPRRTLRRALATFAVPFRPARRAKHRDKPRLVLLCDISDSVRAASRFMLELAYASQELFDRTRTFVFVSELGETTRLFHEESIHVALARAYGGGVVSIADDSNYGRVLRTFVRDHAQGLDRRTTVVILGDGRTNYHDDAAEVIDRLRDRARAVLWFCPEARAGWSVGDSAMSRYAERCTRVLEVKCAADLEIAARVLLSLR